MTFSTYLHDDPLLIGLRGAARRVVLAGVAMVSIAAPSTARAQTAAALVAAPAPFDVPAWAFPLTPIPSPAPYDSITLHRVPKSSATFTAAQAQNKFGVADWYPSSHPAMPDVVARGRRPAVAACGFCHLPDGIGRPENALLAGLPAAYILEQLADMRSRARTGGWPGPNRLIENMRTIADSVTEAEATDAARYFSRLHAHRRSRVVETTEIPRVVPAVGFHLRSPDGGVEPLGMRLIEIPVDRVRHELHDARTDYVAWVPPGSIARGRMLATTARANGVQSCASCHGPRLRGLGVAPPITGQSPSYILRQLLAFRTGARSSPAGAPMRAAAATLGIEDMIAAAAYVGSRDP